MPGLRDALGIQPHHGADPWYRRAACIGQPFARFFPEPGSRKGEQGSKVFEDRARRICARCPVRRPCLREAITAEEPTTAIVRNVAIVSGRSAPRARSSERILAVGLYAGTSPDERWAPDVVHKEGCNYPLCQGCRPLSDRLDILEQRFRELSPRFLTASERVAG